MVEQSSCPHSHRPVNNFGEFRNDYESIFSAESPAALPVQSRSPAHRVRLSVFRRTKESNWLNNTKGQVLSMLLIKTLWKQNTRRFEESAQLSSGEFARHNHKGAIFVTKAASPYPLSLELERIASFYRRLRAAFVGLGGRERSREDSEPYFSYFDRAALPWILCDCLFPLRIGHGAVSPFLCQLGHFKSSDISRTFAAVLAICPIASSGPTIRVG